MSQFREPWHVHDTPERCWIHDSAEELAQTIAHN